MFTRKIHAAFDYAARCHASHLRKGTQTPYLSHLMGVGSLVMEAASAGEQALPPDFEDLVVAALLHDAVEDCGGPPVLEDIRRTFGDRVADIVEHCTDAMPAPGEEKAPWAQRKQRYLDHLERTDDYCALLVSAADKLHNTRAILTDLRTYEREGRPQSDFWRRFVDDKPGAALEQRVPEILWYYQSLAALITRKSEHAHGHGASSRLARLACELDSAVKAMLGFASRAGFEAKAPVAR